jgi:hypothetical protein
VKVTVTRQDIRNGRRLDAAFCPVSFAVKRATGSGRVFACSQCLEVDNEVIEPAPRSVARFVNAFDRGRPVKPFAFILKVAK